MDQSEQLRIIKASKQVHSTWYRTTYPEVAALEMDPAAHYLRYGAAMGRNPGKTFDTRHYLSQYPDVAKSGLNPLVHYMQYGKDMGYSMRPGNGVGLAHVTSVRAKLLSLGFTDRPLQELESLGQTAEDPLVRATAARELALWHARCKTTEGYAKALEILGALRGMDLDLPFRRRLAVMEVLCHHYLGDNDAAWAAHERAALAGETWPDLTLALTNLLGTAEERIAIMNQVLAQYNLSPIRLLPGDDLSPYDRLSTAVSLPAVTDGPKITVLIAAYDAPDTLPTALRSLQEQTWKNLEILVLDDCSPTLDTVNVANAFAADDPRIKVIRMERNAGAYVARNHGLDIATGEYVTLHDADDWSHPSKIETQIRFLLDNPEVVGCHSDQARVFSDLTFNRWTGHGGFIIANTSSFMFHKQRMKGGVGYWDDVRFSADNELIRRIREVYGKGAVKTVVTGPLSFQRDSSTSIIADAVMGINGFFFGARKEYFDAQAHYRKVFADKLSYAGSGEARPFPAPILMLPERKKLGEELRHLDVVIGADLRGAGLEGVLAELQRLHEQGLSIGVFELNRYDHALTQIVSPRMSGLARDTIWKLGARIIAFGEEVECRELQLWNPAILQERQRYLPTIRPASVRLVMEDLAVLADPQHGPLTRAVSRANAMADEYFGMRPVWDPLSPELRGLLAETEAEVVNIAPEMQPTTA